MNPTSRFNARFTIIIGLIVAAAAARLLPHLPNATPVAALALFSGAYLGRRAEAFLIPLIAMLASDLLLGFHHGMAAVYLCFLVSVGIGIWVNRRFSVTRLIGATFASSVLFFLVTNFSTWALGDGSAATNMYPRTMEGLEACYIAALPFFRNTLLGDFFYTALLFGGMALADRRISESHIA